jgi:hypothetical protein
LCLDKGTISLNTIYRLLQKKESAIQVNDALNNLTNK